MQIIFEFVLHRKRQESKLNITWSVQFPLTEILFCLTCEAAGERERKAKNDQHRKQPNTFRSSWLKKQHRDVQYFDVFSCLHTVPKFQTKINNTKIFKPPASYCNKFSPGLVKMLFVLCAVKGGKRVSDVSEELEVWNARVWSVDRQGQWAAFRVEDGFWERERMKNGLTIKMDVQAVLCVYLESNYLRWMKW